MRSWNSCLRRSTWTWATLSKTMWRRLTSGLSRWETFKGGIHKQLSSFCDCKHGKRMTDLSTLKHSFLALSTQRYLDIAGLACRKKLHVNSR